MTVYYYEEIIRYFIECVTLMYLSMDEVSKGITYFKKNTKGNKHIEYDVLEYLEIFELYDEWIKEYEENINVLKDYPRLKEKYQEYKEKINIKKENEM